MAPEKHLAMGALLSCALAACSAQSETQPAEKLSIDVYGQKASQTVEMKSFRCDGKMLTAEIHGTHADVRFSPYHLVLPRGKDADRQVYVALSRDLDRYFAVSGNEAELQLTKENTVHCVATAPAKTLQIASSDDLNGGSAQGY